MVREQQLLMSNVYLNGLAPPAGCHLVADNQEGKSEVSNIKCRVCMSMKVLVSNNINSIQEKL